MSDSAGGSIVFSNPAGWVVRKYTESNYIEVMNHKDWYYTASFCKIDRLQVTEAYICNDHDHMCDWEFQDNTWKEEDQEPFMLSVMLERGTELIPSDVATTFIGLILTNDNLCLTENDYRDIDTFKRLFVGDVC